MVTAEKACASTTTPLTNMSFQLDWKYNAQFAGIFMADYTGGLASAGVNLEVREWDNGINVVDEVANGKADFACVEQNLVIAAQAEGAPVKAVATMFQFSPYGLMSTNDTQLEDLMDLEGTEVGVHLDGLKVMDLVMGVNNITNINVTEIPYADKWLRVEDGSLAAVQCYVIDEPIGVETTYGEAPVVLRLSDFGLGWKDVLADKEGAAAIVVENYVPEGSVYKDVAYQTQTLVLLEPYVLVEGRPIGEIEPGVWKEAAELMFEYGIVDSLPENLDSTLATEYYTGPIEFEECNSGAFAFTVSNRLISSLSLALVAMSVIL